MQSERKVNVSFLCQRCLQPLKLDSSFSSLGEHTLAELSLPVTISPEVDLEAAVIDHFVPPFQLDDSGNGINGFTLLGTQREPGDLSHFMKVTASLFDTLSSNSEIDHPLCEECTDMLIDLMDQQLKLMEDEWDDYKNFLGSQIREEHQSMEWYSKKVKENGVVVNLTSINLSTKRGLLKTESFEENIEVLNKELKDLLVEEERLKFELSNAQQEEQAITLDLEEQKKNSEKLDVEEVRYWKEYTKHRHEFILIEEEFKSLNCQLAYTKGQLEKLKKTNVFNATFHIWHSGHFGTINNFKLGRLPSAPVDWSEINAAWGQTALLLSALANKMNLKFEKYRLVPYGNHSYIEVISEQKVLPLFGSGGFKFLWDNKFDSAMAAFLECLQQFKEEVEKGRSGFCLPYRMENGRLEDSGTGNSFSVKIQFNSEEQWTKALKFLLTNLKWGLAWVSNELAHEKEYFVF